MKKFKNINSYKSGGQPCWPCVAAKMKAGGESTDWMGQIKSTGECTGANYYNPAKCNGGAKAFATRVRPGGDLHKAAYGGEAPMNMAQEVGQNRINIVKDYAANAAADAITAETEMEAGMNPTIEGYAYGGAPRFNLGGQDNIFGMKTTEDPNLALYGDVMYNANQNRQDFQNNLKGFAVDTAQNIDYNKRYNTMYGPESKTITKSNLNRKQLRQDIRSDNEELAAGAKDFKTDWKSTQKNNRKAGRDIFFDKMNPFTPNPEKPIQFTNLGPQNRTDWTKNYLQDPTKQNYIELGGNINPINNSNMNYFNHGGSFYKHGGPHAPIQEGPYRFEGANTGMTQQEFYDYQLQNEGPYRHEGGNTGMSRAEFMDIQNSQNTAPSPDEFVTPGATPIMQQRYGGAPRFDHGGTHTLGWFGPRTDGTDQVSGTGVTGAVGPAGSTGGPLVGSTGSTGAAGTTGTTGGALAFMNNANNVQGPVGAVGAQGPNSNVGPTSSGGNDYVSWGANADYLKNHARFHDDPRYNEMIKKRLFSGKYEYNPSNGQIRKLPQNQWTQVPKDVLANMNRRDGAGFDYTTLYDSKQPLKEDNKNIAASNVPINNINSAGTQDPSKTANVVSNAINNNKKNTSSVSNTSTVPTTNTKGNVTATNNKTTVPATTRGNVSNDGTQGGTTSGNVQQSNIYAPGSQIGYAGVPYAGGNRLHPGMRVKNNYIPGGYGVNPVMYNADKTYLDSYKNKQRAGGIRGGLFGNTSKTKMKFSHNFRDQYPGTPVTNPQPDPNAPTFNNYDPNQGFSDWDKDGIPDNVDRDVPPIGPNLNPIPNTTAGQTIKGTTPADATTTTTTPIVVGETVNPATGTAYTEEEANIALQEQIQNDPDLQEEEAAPIIEDVTTEEVIDNGGDTDGDGHLSEAEKVAIAAKEEVPGTPPLDTGPGTYQGQQEIDAANADANQTDEEAIDEIVTEENNPNVTGANQNILTNVDETATSDVDAVTNELNTEEDFLQNPSSMLKAEVINDEEVNAGAYAREQQEAGPSQLTSDLIESNQWNSAYNKPEQAYLLNKDAEGATPYIDQKTAIDNAVQGVENLDNAEYITQADANALPNTIEEEKGLRYGGSNTVSRPMYNSGGQTNVQLADLHTRLKNLEAEKANITSLITRQGFNSGQDPLSTMNGGMPPQARYGGHFEPGGESGVTNWDKDGDGIPDLIQAPGTNPAVTEGDWAQSTVKTKEKNRGLLDNSQWLGTGLQVATQGITNVLNADDEQAAKEKMIDMTVGAPFEAVGATDGKYFMNDQQYYDPKGQEYPVQFGAYTKYGGSTPMLKKGGEYYLSDEEIEYIQSMGGEIEFLD